MKLATLCYIRKDGKTLMLHRVKKANDIHEGKYNGVGGKMEAGETPEECIIREAQEETGFTIQDPILKGFLTFPNFAKGEDWYVFVFEAYSFTGEQIESSEGNLEWIDDDQVLSLNLWGGDRYFMEWMRAGKFFSGKFIYKDGELVSYEGVFQNQVQ